MSGVTAGMAALELGAAKTSETISKNLSRTGTSAKLTSQPQSSAGGVSKVHGNSLQFPGKNYGYTLNDRNTGQVLKYGESIRPEQRYSQNYLNQNNARMNVQIQGSKAEVHDWQHQQIMSSLQKNGALPKLNKSKW